MINLYKANETNFKHNQYVLSEILSCDGTEEINSVYELNMEFPLNDSKNISSLIVPENIIKVPSYDDREPQLFVIRRAKPNIENNTISCYAQAIGIAKLENNPVLAVNVENKNRKQAVQQILTNAFNSHNFNSGNRDSSSNLNNISVENCSVITALIGDNENTIKNIYGGEVIFDNFAIDFVDSRGKNNGISVTYAKNIVGAELSMDDLDMITEIIPIGADNLMLPEKSVCAVNFDVNNPFTKIVEFNDIGVVEAEYDENGNCTNADKVVTQEQAFELLRQACRYKFSIEKVNELKFNLTLNFIELLDCIDFDGNDYSQIQDKRVAIGDYINVNIKPLNISLKGRISKLTRDKITGKLKSAEMGYKKTNILNTINKTNTKIKNTNKKVDDTKKELKEDIKEANKKTDNLKVILQAKDSEIELSISNEIYNRIAAINILDGKINLRVARDEFNSEINILEEEISSKVAKGEFGSLIEQHYDEIKIAIQTLTNMNVLFNSFGQTIENGAFQIKNQKGDLVFKVDISGQVWIKDLEIINVSDSSWFYNSLVNMDKTFFKTLSTNKLSMQDSHFDLTKDGTSGYTLSDFIVEVLKDYNLV